MKMGKYAKYLLDKNKGDIDFTMKIVKNSLAVSLEEGEDEETILNEAEIFQQLEVEKTKRAS